MHMLNPKFDNRVRAYNFALAIIDTIKVFPHTKQFNVFSDQLLRSATSVGANLIEAKAASSKKDFAHFYQIALKSANESLFWLCLLRDSKLVPDRKLDTLICEAEEISKMLGASLLTMRGRRNI